jgi:chromosome segregation ATPase
LVEREIGNCQEQIGFARNDVQKLTRQVEEARREADRLRDECRVLEARIRDIDSEIERLAENARRHRREAKKSENAAIAWGVGGLLLAPFTFGASVVVAAPATVVNVVNMEEERSRASDCEESKREYERSLRDKETQKSNWNARIRDLSADCTKKENHIETLIAMTKLLDELKTFLHKLSSSFDTARLTVLALIEEMQSIRRGTQTVDIFSRSKNEHKWTFGKECLTATLQAKWDELVSFLKNYSSQ